MYDPLLDWSDDAAAARRARRALDTEVARHSAFALLLFFYSF